MDQSGGGPPPLQQFGQHGPTGAPGQRPVSSSDSSVAVAAAGWDADWVPPVGGGAGILSALPEPAAPEPAAGAGAATSRPEAPEDGCIAYRADWPSGAYPY